MNNLIKGLILSQGKIIFLPMEIILEVVIVLLFRYPGAFIRWMFLHKQRTFDSLLKEDPYINATLSIAILGGIALLISKNAEKTIFHVFNIPIK